MPRCKPRPSRPKPWTESRSPERNQVRKTERAARPAERPPRTAELAPRQPRKETRTKETMPKIRVHQLAKELDIDSKIVMDVAYQHGIEVKNHMSALDTGAEFM